MIRVAILTVSDSSAQGTRPDESGPALCRCCQELNWPVVTTAIVPDEVAKIAAQLQEWADNKDISLILTTGGTGVALRDVTPEATRGILHREIPGISELMRAKGMEQTKYSVLSRSVAGTRSRSLIVNLPGSPRGALHGLKIIEPLVPHIIELLQGQTAH